MYEMALTASAEFQGKIDVKIKMFSVNSSLLAAISNKQI